MSLRVDGILRVTQDLVFGVEMRPYLPALEYGYIRFLWTLLTWYYLSVGIRLALLLYHGWLLA